MKPLLPALLSGALFTLLAALPASAQTLDLARIETVADSVAHTQIAAKAAPQG